MNILEYENYQETKRHGDITFPYDTYLCTIPMDFLQVPLHWHEEMELIYVKKGKGMITVNLTPFSVEKGSIILVLPGQLHGIQREAWNQMEYENIIFHPGILMSRQLDSCSSEFLLPLFSGKKSVPAHFAPGMPGYEALAQILDTCDRIGAEKPLGYAFAIKAQLNQLFFLLESRFQTGEPSSQNSKQLERMKPVLKYIEHHYSEHIIIEEMAKLIACSPSHFMRSFKEVFQCSFVTYLKEYRLSMSTRLLAGSDLPILTVAENVGFDNLSYFNRSFKEKYGMTPGQYRKK